MSTYYLKSARQRHLKKAGFLDQQRIKMKNTVWVYGILSCLQVMV